MNRTVMTIIGRFGAPLAAVTLIAGCGGSSGGGGVTHVARNPSTAIVRQLSSTTTSKAVPLTKAGPSTKAAPSMLAFAKCMRAHGVPNYPDPRPPSQIPPTHTTEPAPSGGFTANPNSPGYQTASNDCRSLADATPVTQVQTNQMAVSQLKFASCMRAHGVPSFPDPTSTGDIGSDGAISGMNQNSPAFQSAEETCSKFRPVPPGVPPG
jgi:hypothetical protein